MLKRAEFLFGLFGAVLLFVLMAVTFVDVLGRNVINKPLTGASELTEVLLALIIFLMLPQVALRQQHIVIDLIDGVAGRIGRAVLDIFAALISAAMFGLIAMQLWVLGDKSAGYADATPSLGIPLAPVFYVLAVLAAINVLAFLIAIPISIGRRDDPVVEGVEGASDPEKLSVSV